MEEAITIPVKLLDQILIATQPTIRTTVIQRGSIGWNKDQRSWSIHRSSVLIHQCFVHTPASTIMSTIVFAGSSPFCILRNAEIMIMIMIWPESLLMVPKWIRYSTIIIFGYVIHIMCGFYDFFLKNLVLHTIILDVVLMHSIEWRWGLIHC
jgi:hypothetical protein